MRALIALRAMRAVLGTGVPVCTREASGQQMMGVD